MMHADSCKPSQRFSGSVRQRGKLSVLISSGQERLEAGDIVALAGMNQAVEAAQQVLSNRSETGGSRSLAAKR
jgi:Trk K+ transport system NAD-binding subunit